jgi:hypothetical protein
MRSIRLDEQMDGRVRRAAAAEGISVSEFLRRAADQRADATLSRVAADRLADVVGVVRSDRRQARRSGKAFGDLLVDKRAKGK